MMQETITLNQKTVEILNLIKKKNNLTSNSDAVNLAFISYFDTYEIKPTYVDKLKKIGEKDSIAIGKVSELVKKYE